MLHTADNCNYIPFGNPGHDPLFEIQAFIEILQEKFREGLVPEQNLSLNEVTCPFKERINSECIIMTSQKSVLEL